MKITIVEKCDPCSAKLQLLRPVQNNCGRRLQFNTLTTFVVAIVTISSKINVKFVLQVSFKIVNFK